MNAALEETTHPKTLVSAIRYFSDIEVAHDFFAKMRFPNGAFCPRCGSTAVRYLAKYRRYQCSSNHDARQFTVKTGTVMEDSPLGLDKWATAFWLEVNSKNSISSYELHRAIGITQKSAWFMLHRVRFALRAGSINMGGEGSAGVEVDETFVGGLAKFMHRSKRAKLTGSGPMDKTAVVGILDRNVVEHVDGKKKVKRHSKVLASVIANTQKQTLHAIIHKHVEKGSNVYTDAWKSYDGLSPEYIHAFIDHAQKYVDGKIHTNGLENFWSLFKRCIKGTHVSVEPFHLQAYVDSEIFRFNKREFNDGERFAMALPGMIGKRLTYKKLIASDTTEFLPTSEDNGAAGENLPVQ